MKKRLLIFALLLTFLLAACGGVETSQGVTPTSPPPESTAETVDPGTDPIATNEPIKVGESTVPEPMTTLGNGCTLTSSEPEASEEYALLFGVTENDWVKGPETAALTIVEYGDFQ